MLTPARVDAYRRQSPGRRDLTSRQLARIARKAIRRGEMHSPNGAWSGGRRPLVNDYRCCALQDGHDGPCAWRCTGCAGTGDCPACRGTGGPDDVVYCEFCQGGGACTSGCVEGWHVDE